jgi:hypothetical protein
MIHPLPYRDSKATGAADFYFAINATFRFIRETLGTEALHKYWSDLGREYYAPVWRRWKEGGLTAVQEYWRAFFEAEPGAVADVLAEEGGVVLDVRICPAIRRLREGGRKIEPDFCQHCYYVSEAAAREAGLTVRIKGGNGRCRQTFHEAGSFWSPQNMEEVEQAS